MATLPVATFEGRPMPRPIDPVVRNIAKFAATASFEMAARDFRALAEARQTIPAGSTVSIPWLPNDTHDDRLAAARAVRAVGLEPLPHVAARRLGDAQDFDRLSGRLRDEAGVTQLFLVSGDTTSARGEYDCALELLARGRLNHRGYDRVGFAGYPEGHLARSRATLEAALDTRIALALDQGLDPFVIAQFAFDHSPIQSWIAAFRERHDGEMVRIGLAGPAKIQTLLRYAQLCGIGASSRALIRDGASIARLLREAAPDAVIRRIVEAGLPRTQSPVAMHIFPFGGLQRSTHWIDLVSRGKIRLRSSESGFDLDR